MIEDTIASLETRIQAASGLTDIQRADLQKQLDTLKAEAAAHDKSGTVHHGLEGLSDAVAGQEAQHPRITELINSISNVLSNTGI